MTGVPVPTFSTALAPQPPSKQRNNSGTPWTIAATWTQTALSGCLCPADGERHATIDVPTTPSLSTRLGTPAQAPEQTVI